MYQTVKQQRRFQKRQRRFLTATIGVVGLVALVAVVALMGALASGPEAEPARPTALAQATAPAVTDSPAPEPTATAGPVTAAAENVAPAAAESDTPEPAVATVAATPEPTATPAETAAAVNGVPVTQFVVLPEGVQAQVREIFARGQSLGRDPRAFAKMGDSTIIKPQMLGLFDKGAYRLGEFDYLQPAIDHYAGSFDRYGLASYEGLHSWSVFDPLWASKEWCEPNEHMVACEFRYQNPSLFIIRLGSNDSGAPSSFERNLREVVQYTLDEGVIPILATKADRFEGADNTNNLIIRQVAADFEAPLWDYDLVAETLPDRGLDTDQIHLKVFEVHDYTLAETFSRGHSMQDLTGLMMIHALWQILNGS